MNIILARSVRTCTVYTVHMAILPGIMAKNVMANVLVSAFKLVLTFYIGSL